MHRKIGIKIQEEFKKENANKIAKWMIDRSTLSLREIKGKNKLEDRMINRVSFSEVKYFHACPLK